MSIKNQTAIPIISACLGSIFIGASGIFVRLSDLGPITTGFYRLLFAIPFLGLWLAWERKKCLSLTFFPQKDYLGLVAAGFFFCD